MSSYIRSNSNRFYAAVESSYARSSGKLLRLIGFPQNSCELSRQSKERKGWTKQALGP